MTDTTSSAVTAGNITSTKNSFTTNQYGSDAAKGILSNVSIRSQLMEKRASLKR